jgi:hypothetical protein
MVTVYAEGQIVAATSSTGNSEELQYDYMGYLQTWPPMQLPLHLRRMPQKPLTIVPLLWKNAVLICNV